MLGLHTTADPNGLPWADYAAQDRIAPMFLRSVLYMARTELFIVISVFLLLSALDRRPRTYLETIREQSRRLLIPFLFWTVFYAGYGLIKADAFGYFDNALKELMDPAEWFGYLTLGSVKYHMHFIPTVFGVVLFFPLYRLAVRYPALGIAVVICLIVKRELDGFIFSTFWGTEILPYLVRTAKVLTYVGYGMAAGAALGIWQKTTPETRRQWFGPIVFFGGLLFLIKLIATWKTVESGQWPFGYTPGYWADFLFPVVLFGGCMALGNLRWPLLISKLAPYAFGIYLCHPIFLDLTEIWLRDSQLSPIAQIGLKSGLTLMATSLLVYLVSRIPLVAWTIGLGALPKLWGSGSIERKTV